MDKKFVIYEDGKDPVRVDRLGAEKALSELRLFEKGTVEIRELVHNVITGYREEVTIFRKDGGEE